MFVLLTIFACASPTPDAGPLFWQGQVYNDIPIDGVGGLAEGAIEVRDMDGETLTLGTQPETNNLSTWRLSLSGIPEEVELRISGPEQLTTVWRTTLPDRRSFWFSGTFFAVKAATMAPMWEALGEMTGETLNQSGGASLYGESLPLNDTDLAAWTGAEVTVYDAEGGVHPAITLSTTEEGFLVLADDTTGPVSAFTVTDLPVGPLRLVIDASDGRHVVMDYNAEAGELLSAFAFTLPENK